MSNLKPKNPASPRKLRIDLRRTRLTSSQIFSALALFAVAISPIDVLAQSTGLSANTDSVGATASGLSSTAQGTAIRSNEVRATDAGPIGSKARQTDSALNSNSNSNQTRDTLLGSSRCGDSNYRRDRKRGQKPGSRLSCDDE